MKLGKVENWEMEIRIDQGSGGKDENWESRKLENEKIELGIFNREGREVTRRRGGKEETWESGKSGN